MKILLITISILFLGCQLESQNMSKTADSVSTESLPEKVVPIHKSKKEWKNVLSSDEYYVLRKKGTERAFTGSYWKTKDAGIYYCAACGLALFDSDTKYKSGTGWPSFYQPIREDFIEEDSDHLLGYKRTEVHCARCGGHLGHVFPDGPKPTGLRYCINSVSLRFEEKAK